MNLINLLISEFNDDFLVLQNLPVNTQIEIYRILKTEINSFSNQLENINYDEALTKIILTNLSQSAKEKRNQAVRRGAINKKDVNWLSAALLEHTYNSMLSEVNSAIQHINGKINDWMQDISITEGEKMGLLDSLLEKPESPSNDGLWLKTYRGSEWLSIAKFSGGSQSINCSRESCYVDHKDSTFCILMSVDNSKSLISYFLCFISQSIDDEISIIAHRTEDFNSKTVKEDEWSNAKISFKEITTPGIKKGIASIKAIAKFNSYSTDPPYLLIMNYQVAKNR